MTDEATTEQEATDEWAEMSDAERSAMREYLREIEDYDLYVLTNPDRSFHVNITLFVGGKTICGQPCSVIEWLEIQDKRLQEAAGLEVSFLTGRVKVMEEWKVDRDAAEEKSKKGEPMTEDDYRTLHEPARGIYLKDAWEVGSEGPVNEKTLIKVKRSAVDGWLLGTLGASK